MACIFASQVEQFSDALVTLAASSGGTTTQTFTYYYWFSGLTRGGLNKLTPLGQRTVNAGQKLTFTFTDSLPNACDTIALVLSASTTNDLTTATLLAIIPLVDSDQVTQRSLPLSASLTKDSHFALNSSVSDLTTLPPQIFGTPRYSGSQYYFYDSEGWHPDRYNPDTDTYSPGWVPINGISTYIADTTDPRTEGQLFGGCDCPIYSLTANSILPYPPWDGLGGYSYPQKVWILNGLTEEAGTIWQEGYAFDLVAFLNGNQAEAIARLGDVTEVTPTYRIRRSTGTRVAALSGEPVAFTPGDSIYRLTEPVNRGYGIEFTVSTRAILADGETWGFWIQEAGEYGVYDVNDNLGSVVFAENSENPTLSEYARILPTRLGLRRSRGIGRIDTRGSIGGYTFAQNSPITITGGLDPNTADQLVAISGLRNGACRVVQLESELEQSEAIRAIVSTESGVQYASEWSNTITISNNSRVQLTFDLPTVIRANYPDAIAGTPAEYNADEIIVQLQLNGTTNYYYSGYAPSTSPMTIILSGTGGAIAPTINSDLDFGLFDYSEITIVELSGGTLPNGNCRVKLFSKYNGNSVSKISHDTANGVQVVEYQSTLAELISKVGKVKGSNNDESFGYLEEKLVSSSSIIRVVNDEGGEETISLVAKYNGEPVATKAALKALPVAGEFTNRVRVVAENVASYLFVSNLPQADDGDNYLLSDDTVSNQGWQKLSGSGSGGNGLTQVANIAALKAIANTAIANHALVQVTGTLAIYQRLNGVTTAENSPFVIQPNDYSTVNAVYRRLNAYDQNGNLVFNSDALTQGSTNLLMTAAERAKLAGLPSSAVPTSTGISATLPLTVNRSTLDGNLQFALTTSGLSDKATPAATDKLFLDDGTGIKSVQVGNLGVNGKTAYTVTTQPFLIPNVGSNVLVYVSAAGQYSNAGFDAIGLKVMVGIYEFEVAQAIASPTNMTLKYIGESGLVDFSIPDGSIVQVGRRGATGPAGAIAGASSVVIDQDNAPAGQTAKTTLSSISTQLQIRFATGDLFTALLIETALYDAVQKNDTIIYNGSEFVLGNLPKNTMADLIMWS